MKHLLPLLLALLISISCQKKELKAPQEDTIYMNYVIKEEVIDFMIEAEDRGIDVLDKIMILDSIILVPNDRFPGLLGLYQNNNIYISKNALNDRLMLKATVYHELFHAVGGIEHCHKMGNDIMCAVNGPNWTYGVYLNKVFWEASLDREFNKMK